MYGRATLAMLVSRTSMNAAMATTTAISQGLARGCQTSWRAAATPDDVWASAIRDRDSLWVHVHGRSHRHARAQQPFLVVAGIKVDPDRNPLDHLDVVARGVL